MIAPLNDPNESILALLVRIRLLQREQQDRDHSPERDYTDSVFMALMEIELARASSKHRGLTSAHEAYAVVLEEVDEWWDEIKGNDPTNGLLELIQVAAMCMRAARDVYGIDFLGASARYFQERLHIDLQHTGRIPR